jgi:RHS repeat-associated protein
MVLFESATTLHALLGDHLNTVRDVVSPTGTLENHLVYNSYGELKSQTGGAYSPFHRFTGKPFDTAVGLQYNVNRWYDPATGRWTSEDPIGFSGGHANLYAYIGNSPMNGTDPFGYFTQPGGETRPYQPRREPDFITSSIFDFPPLTSPSSAIPEDRSDFWEEFDERERRRERAEELRRIAEAPSLSEPPTIDLAIEGIGVLLGGWLGKVDDVADAGRGLIKVASSGDNILPAQTVREIVKGERVPDLIQELAERTYTSGGLEHAIISLQNGPRVIVQGGAGGIILPSNLNRVIIHTHPFPTGPSALDFQMLEQTGQQSTWIYELFGGGLIKVPRKK